MKIRQAAVVAAGAIFFALGVQETLRAQQTISKFDREAAEQMLQIIRDRVKEYYYDPSYHGVDLDARYKTYAERISQAPNRGAAFAEIAAYLSALHDSHTFFIPPVRSSVFDYGFRMQLIGDRDYITDLRPGSDAATKLHPGDEVLGLNHFSVNRADFDDLSYYLNELSPQLGVTFELRDPAGRERKEFVKTRVEDRPLIGGNGNLGFEIYLQHRDSFRNLMHGRSQEIGDALIWKVPGFFESNGEVGQMVDKAREHKALIIDLRGDPGGSPEMDARMVGDLMERDVTVTTRLSRKGANPDVAKTRGKNAFSGKLVVLVDSRSASAAELFARVVQLEHRGIVVGDRTSGRVMETIIHHLHFPGEYAVAITEANLIMSDGKSLEGVGVTPDVIVLPTGADLAAGRDPALAKAAELAGVKLTPEEAGKLFPFEWAPLEAE
ncbi:MAG TPA: S41 family peptidase [Candidatus Acidoferrales bacterium]|nr:S41 family peptidase [Candidatus Acidoferrales bacterium]